MIDLHAHILPKMDDGSASVEESIEMLTRMRKTGITTVVATPHFDMRKDTIEHFLRKREKTYQELMKATAGLDVPNILLGAEVLYCGVGLSQIEDIEKLCLGHGRYLLVETLKGIWDATFALDMRKLMAEQNITPVLAHVERYVGARKNKKMLVTLLSEGIMMQTNASTFLRRGSCRRALKMLQEKKIHLLGSDCHNMTMRRPNLAGAVEVIRKRLDESYVEKLTKRAERVVCAEIL